MNKDQIIKTLQNENKKLRSSIDRLEYENKIDHLTGLYNRKYLDDKFISKLEVLSKDNYPFAIIVIDLDNLKKINDTYGHGKGDEYIKEFSNTMTLHIRPNDIVIRMGGDEFIILITDTDDLEKIVPNIIQRIKNDCKTKNIYFSSGFSISDMNSHKFDLTLKSADKKMYKEKSIKKNMLS